MEISSLPPCSDSMLALWSVVLDRIPLSAIALFLPRGDFMELAALRGFPEADRASASSPIPDRGIPYSLARSLRLPSSELSQEASAILSPILCHPDSMILRASALGSSSGLDGLWVYHDSRLDGSSEAAKGRFGSFLTMVSETIPPLRLAPASRDLPKAMLAASKKYLTASIFMFGLDASLGPPAGLEPIALLSALYDAASRVLAQTGSIFYDGDAKIACVLGSASKADPDLALFHFAKTLKRVLPWLDSSAPLAGSASFLDPSSETALEDIRAFLKS